MGGKHKNYKLGYFQKNLKRLEQHTHTHRREIDDAQKAPGQNSVIKPTFSAEEINRLLTPAEYLPGKLKSKNLNNAAWNYPDKMLIPHFLTTSELPDGR